MRGVSQLPAWRYGVCGRHTAVAHNGVYPTIWQTFRGIAASGVEANVAHDNLMLSLPIGVWFSLSFVAGFRSLESRYAVSSFAPFTLCGYDTDIVKLS